MSTKHRNFIDHQLLVDIFGFLPNYITDDLYDAMNICLYNVTEGFTKRFIALYPEKGTLISEVCWTMYQSVYLYSCVVSIGN